MVIPNGVNIPMPRPYGGTPPVISSEPRRDGVAGTLYTVQFTDEIGPMTQYLELFEVMDSAKENDQIRFVINSPGGDVYTAQQIVGRMHDCKAQVITVASGLVASAATFVWCAGKQKEVGRWGRFMFHSSLHGDWGKSLAIQENATETVNYMKNILTEEMKTGILLGQEVAKILRDKADVEIPGSVMRSRLAKLVAECEGDQGVQPVETPAEGQPAEPATPEPPAEASTFDPEAIFRAEGVEDPQIQTQEVQPAEGGEQTTEDQPPADPAQAPAARCGGKKQKLYRKVRKADGSEEFVEVPAEEQPAAPAKPAEDPVEQPVEPSPVPAQVEARRSKKRKALHAVMLALEYLMAEGDADTADSDITVGTEPEEADPDQAKNKPTLPENDDGQMKEAPGTTDDESRTVKETVFDPEAIFRAEGVEEPVHDPDCPGCPDCQPEKPAQQEIPVTDPNEAEQGSDVKVAPAAPEGRYW